VLTLHTLGECRITLAPPARPPTTLDPAAGRLFALALVLAADGGRPRPRAEVAAWLWPELPPARARRRLRQALYRLRALGAPVAADADHLYLPRAAVAPTFAARPTPAALCPADPAATPRLGRCLPGWTPAGDALRDWADAYRDRIEAAARAALTAALAHAAPVNGGDDAHCGLAHALVALDPAHPIARRVAGGRAAPRAVHEPAPAAYDALAAPIPPDGDEALALLGARVAAARAGAGGLVVLAGPPDAPVSALLAAFADRVDGARVAYVDAAPHAVGPRASGAGLPRAVARALVACGAPAAALPPGPRDAPLAPAVLGRLGAVAAEAGPVVVCLDHAECAGADALGAVAGAAAAWGAVPVLVVVACAGVWPRGGRDGRAGPAEEAGAAGAARRWGARLAEVAASVADGRPLLVRVDAVRDA
jgi:DNA-binding SARP family transcriptional activator